MYTQVDNRLLKENKPDSSRHKVRVRVVFRTLTVPSDSVSRICIFDRPGKHVLAPCHDDDASMTCAKLRRRQTMHGVTKKRPRKERKDQGAVYYKIVGM